MKKLIAAVSAIALTFSTAFTAFAAETADVYVTISDGTGALPVAQEKITVTDIDADGILTINDALHIAHEEYYKGGAEAGFVSGETEYGLSLNKLWGVENGGSYGYYKNNVSAMSLSDTIVDGDYITAYAFSDLTSWSTDVYSWFDINSAELDTDRSTALALSYAGYDADWNPVTLFVSDAVITINGEKTNLTTDAQGKVEIKFDEAGEYVISAVSDTQTLVPPVCKVTVTASSTESETTAPATGNSTSGLVAVTAIALLLLSSQKEMKSKILTVISCAAAFLLLILKVSAADISTVYEDITKYNLNECGADTVQEWIDTSLAENAGTSSEWYAITLSQSGNYDFTEYIASLEAYLQNNNVRSATSRQKYAFALLAVGSSSDYIGETMENSIGEQGLMSYVYGLHLLNNGCTSSQHTVDGVVEQILSMQLSDGGWAVMGEYGDPDVTAMTIQALASHYKNNEKVSSAVDKAVQFLSDKQLESGGYKSMGKETSESITQVIIALTSLGINAETDSRFIKNGSTLFSALEQFRLDDGSYCHETGGESNHIATVQAFMAAAAYEKKTEIFILNNNAEVEEISVETEESIVTVVEEKQEKTVRKVSYKFYASIIIAGAVCGVCIILWLMKKRNRKNFVAVAAIGVIAVIIVISTDFSSTDDYYGTTAVKKNPVGTVEMEIRCDTVAGRTDYIPENGVILDKTEYAFEAGETVYDILVEACRENSIQADFSGGYVSGINNIYEFGFGDLSGWLYFVNGEEASVGCEAYELSDGDRIEWHYSCEMGNDLK